jgi:hypothetical protein
MGKQEFSLNCCSEVQVDAQMVDNSSGKIAYPYLISGHRALRVAYMLVECRDYAECGLRDEQQQHGIEWADSLQ